MSRKQTSKPQNKTNKKMELERKRDERAARKAIAKDRKNQPHRGNEGAEFLSLANQLLALGLKLREVPGDGNCLFRALNDQLEGHSRNHLQLRQETVQYMVNHRQDFEPFVDNSLPFATHLHNLSQPGTFAGNDAIVAFARCQQVKVVIHQLNTALWEINGTEKPVVRELHIAYRYGDHYDSVRRIGDNKETPAQLRIEHLQESAANQRETRSPPTEEDNVILSSVRNRGCHSDEENLHQLTAATINSEWLSASCGSESRSRTNSTHCSENKPLAESSNTPKPKVSNKQRKEQQRLEKKKRQEERHRQKVLDARGGQDQNRNLPDNVTIIHAVNTLTI